MVLATFAMNGHSATVKYMETAAKAGISAIPYWLRQSLTKYGEYPACRRRKSVATMRSKLSSAEKGASHLK
jgi:hypothetical protein